jgi:hypothetical protein
MRSVVTAWVFLLLLPAALPGQQPPLAVQYDEVLSSRRAVEGLSPSENRELMAALDYIVDMLRNIPGVQQGVPGRCVRLYSEVAGSVSEPARPVGSAAAAIGLRVELVGRCPEGFNAIVWVYINRIVQPGWVVFEDEQGPAYMLNAETPGRGPYLDFRLRGERYIVLTRGGRPVYQPVARERLLRHRAAELRQRIARFGPESEAFYRRDLDSIEAALRSLSPAALAAQACAAQEVRFLVSPDGGCRYGPPLVSFTPLAFDTTGSRGAVQTITITTTLPDQPPRGTISPQLEASLRIWSGLDLAALAALIR